MNRNKVFKHGLVIESENLSDLLGNAKKILLKSGRKSRSQRGYTWSLNNVLLVWQNPEKDKTRFSFWPKKDDDWYYKVFVEKSKRNLPEQLAQANDLLFPYKYSHRSRFYDSSWGYGLAVCYALSALGVSVNSLTKSRKYFIDVLENSGRQIHLQTLLSVLLWWGKKGLVFWTKNRPVLKYFVNQSRIDTLSKIIEDVSRVPETRRAVTPSFMYQTDYLLSPMMGVPPYQNFQLLPGQKSESLSSLHWHRSLDTSGGAQLDFNHDFRWLNLACKKTKRKMGTISIIVGNLHLYAKDPLGKTNEVLDNDSIKDRLCMWTDGYRSKDLNLNELMKKDYFAKNVDRVLKNF